MMILKITNLELEGIHIAISFKVYILPNCPIVHYE